MSVRALLRCRCFLHLRTIRLHVVIASFVLSMCFFLLSTRNAKQGCCCSLLIVRRLREGFQHSDCDIVRRSGFAPLELLLPREMYSRSHDHLDHPTQLHAASSIPKQQIASHIKKCTSILLRMTQHGRLPIGRCNCYESCVTVTSFTITVYRRFVITGDAFDAAPYWCFCGTLWPTT